MNQVERSEIIEWATANANQTEEDAILAWRLGQGMANASLSEWPLLPEMFNRLEPLCARKLTTFGEVAAEEDAVLQYFLKTPAVKEISDGKILLVLGRKGSGKTALVRHFTEGAGSKNSRALTLGQYPWKTHEQKADSTVNEVDAYMESWRYLIATQIASIVLASPNIDLTTPEAESLLEFFAVNYGSSSPELGDILRPTMLKLSKASFEPQVMGNKLGSVTLERSNPQVGRELKALTDALLSSVEIIGQQNGIKQIFLHFDELDRGLVFLDDARKNLLIGLVIAAREVAKKCNGNQLKCIPVVYLRTDLWDELKFSDKNKITQGKKTLSLEWAPQSLADLINERIKAAVGRDGNWGTISSPSLLRGSQNKWSHIIARTFLRPRDVISFLNASLDVAVTRKVKDDFPLIIENSDIVGAREKYSSYLKKELEDEIGPHWSHWTDALKAFSSIATVTFKLDLFRAEYDKRKSAKNSLTADEALEKLYEFSVIGFERRSGYGGTSWIFQYTHPDAGWDREATSFKVHTGLKEVAKLREERTSGSSNEEVTS
jgi:energy-coupling factor transporter ATP-binding protein EcfA2